MNYNDLSGKEFYIIYNDTTVTEVDTYAILRLHKKGEINEEVSDLKVKLEGNLSHEVSADGKDLTIKGTTFGRWFRY